MNDVIWSRPVELDGTHPCLVFEPEKGVERLPLVYLLHGQFDTEADWFGAKGQLPGILSGVGARPMILVMPFCGAAKLASPKDQQDPGLDAFAKRFELIEQEVRKRFGSDDRPRGVLGISMGGRQALHLALAGKLTGVSALGVLSGKLQAPYAEELSTLVSGFKGGLPNMSLYFHYCGSGGTDATYFQGNQTVCETLGGRLRTRAEADHNWWFWRPRLADFFRAFDGIAAEQAVAPEGAPGRR